MDLKLSLHEQEELTKICSSFNLDNLTKTLTLKYYLEYRNKVGQIYIEKLPLIINCAIIAASKSQVLTTVKGETVRGIGISITQLMRGFTNPNKAMINFDEFLIVLKEFINTVSLSADVTADLRGIIENFAFSYTFFIKYSNLFKQLELKETSHEDEEFFKNLKNFGWLIFINAKVTILQNQTELVECFFLLTATLAHMIYYLPSHIPIHFFEKNGKNIYDKVTRRKSEEAILSALQELLKVSSNGYEDILFYHKSLQEYLQKLIDLDVLKSSEPKSFEGLYDHKLISCNFSKLESFYQKRLSHDDLDERFFIRERKPHTPGKFTPFARQGAANKAGMGFGGGLPRMNDQSQPQKKAFSSHRMLNYEVSEQVTMKTNLNEIKFAVNKAVPASPYTRLLPATPMTRALEMYNWLSEKTKIKRTASGLTAVIDKYLPNYGDRFKESIIPRATSLIEKVLTSDREKNEVIAKSSIHQKNLNDKYIQITNFYLKVLEDLLLQEDKKNKDSESLDVLKSDSFHRALITCSIETIFFVNNSSNIDFVKLLELCDIEAFDFWRIIGNFAKFDQQMPYPIKKHLYDLELKILMSLAWKKNSFVHQTVKNMIERTQNEFENAKYTRGPRGLDSPQSSASTEGVQDITESFDNRLNITTDQRSCANTTAFLESSTHSESKIKEDSSFKKEAEASCEQFFKRVLHFTALQVFQMCDSLHLNEKISEQIWGLMKYILSSEVDLLMGRHVEQLILCSIYGACKVANYPIRFQDIIAKYQDLPSFNKHEFLKVIHQVSINDNEKVDLIKFYNTVFVAQTRTFLFSLLPDQAQIDMKSATPLVKKPLIKALVMESPLRESLPHCMIQYASLSSHSKKSPYIKHGLVSPATALQQLQMGNVTGKLNDITNLVSKRQINFDEAHEGGNTTDNNMKKPKFGMMDRIDEQKTEDIETDSNKKIASKRNLFGPPTGAVKRAISFEEAVEGTPRQSGKVPVSFSQMMQPPKSQMIFPPTKNTKVSLENLPMPHNSPQREEQENIDDRSVVGRSFRKL